MMGLVAGDTQSTSPADDSLIKEKKTMTARFNANYDDIMASTTNKAEFVAKVQKTVLGNLMKKYFDVYARQDAAACS